MAHSRDDERPSAEGRTGRLPSWVVGILTLDAIALAMALVTPLMPGRAGSTWTPGRLLWPDPTYLQDVAVGFVIAMLMLYVVVGFAIVAARLGRAP